MNPFAEGTEHHAEWERQQHAEGPAALDAVRAALTRYVILPSVHAEIGVTLWIAATHAAPVLEYAPRLAIRSPQKRCGKTRMLDVVGALCHAPLWTTHASTAAVYRSMGGEHPRTLLMDEVDALWGTRRASEQNEDLRALVNAGFGRGRPVLRYDPRRRTTEELDTWGFVALAGIRDMPDTITDRAVNVVLRRRHHGEQVAPFRSSRDGFVLSELREHLSAWISLALDDIKRSQPHLPVEDRAADVWEGLCAVADVAGGPWPELARAAAVALSREHDDEERETDATRLLGDIRDVFTGARAAFMASRDLVVALRRIDDAPWSDVDLTTRALADRLRIYGVAPRPNTTGTARGYRRTDLTDAWTRYLPPDHASETVNPSGSQVNPLTVPAGLTDEPSDGPRTVSDLSSDSDTLTVSDAVSGSSSCADCGEPMVTYEQGQTTHTTCEKE